MLRVFENHTLDLKLNTLKKGDEVYFKAKEIAGVLGYKRERKAISDHVFEKYRKTWDEIGGPELGQAVEQPHSIYLAEPGLYQLIFSSQQPIAKQFQEWVFEDVLPQIRKEGRYEMKKDIRAMTCFKIENEFDLHRKVVNYIRKYHSDLVLVAGLGENQDNPRKRIVSWQKGYQKGQPDLLLLNAHKKYNGLCLEFKTPKGNGEVSEAQEETLKKYRQQGFKTLISNDYDEVVHEIYEYCVGLRVPCPKCRMRFKSPETLATHLRVIHRIAN